MRIISIIALALIAALTDAKECVSTQTYNFTYNEDYTDLLCNIQNKYGTVPFKNKPELIMYCRILILKKFKTFSSKFGFQRMINKFEYRKIVYTLAGEQFLIQDINIRLVDKIEQNTNKRLNQMHRFLKVPERFTAPQKKLMPVENFYLDLIK